MKRILSSFNRNERGQGLAIVLALLAVGGLTIIPLLTHTHTGISSNQIYRDRMELTYAAEAGMEDGIWRTETDNVSLDPYDYETVENYTLPEAINDKQVDVDIKQIWPLAGLESDENGTTPAAPPLAISGGVINDEGDFQVLITYDTPDVDLYIDRVGVWLPADFAYVADSSNGITTDNPTQIEWNGGTALEWDFDPAVNFDDLPQTTQGDPIEGGMQPSVELPAVRVLSFSVTPLEEKAYGSYSWVRTTDPDNYLCWDTNVTIYQVSATASNSATGRTVTTDGYTYVSEGFDEGWIYTGETLMTGDSRAIGNTMMKDLDSDRRRETVLENSSATISDIPEDGEVVFAFLYWSGWKDWSGAMEPDMQVTFWVRDEPETLRPDDVGDYSECDDINDSPNYQCVDEVTADDDSTYVRTYYGATETDTYELDNHSEGYGTISGVTVYIRSRVDTDEWWGADMAVQTVLRTHSTNYYGDYTELEGSRWDDDYTILSTTYDVNPFTGVEWTWDEIDALQAGVRQYDLDPGDIRTTQVYVEVDYGPYTEYEVTAEKWWLIENQSPDYAYSCFADVTDLVTPVAPIGNARYTVGDVYGDTGTELSYAGWSLIIIYSSPSEEGRQFFIYDSLTFAGTDASGTFTIDGFVAPSDAEATLTCFVGEGDDWYDEDYLQFNGYYMSDATNPENDVWNGKSSGLAGEVIDGIDIDTFDVSDPIIEPGDSSATLTYTTEQDNWNLIYHMLSFRSDQPILTPSSTGVFSWD